VTEVHVERQELDSGSVLLYRDFGAKVRMAYDPSRITEGQALTLLRGSLPKLSHGITVVHPADA
jgi:hypothetical protein